MKFDFIIGNPPYQDETLGENKGYAPPIYHKFLENAYQISDRVELIHPARFLFNAGSTPKQWNKQMLSDPHFKILDYYPKSADVFPNTDITGGVVISYHDVLINYGAIDTFTPYKDLNNILKKVVESSDFSSFSDIVLSRTSYRLTEKMHQDHPEAIGQLSKGHRYDMSTNIFERLPQIFFNSKPDDQYEYIKIYGREGNERTYKYIRRDYVNKVKNLDYYKILVPKSNGSGALGEVIPTPLIGEPLIGEPAVGVTETFITIGSCDSKDEANALLKFVKTKFTRCLLGVLKITQDNPPDTWKYVPLQDYTASSDINWSKSIHEIDQQLYAKYGLNEDEIAFIESHVKEMD